MGEECIKERSQPCGCRRRNEETVVAGSFAYKVYTVSDTEVETIQVTVRDKRGAVVFESNQQRYVGRIDGVQLWWPRDMGSAVLYQFVVLFLFNRLQSD